MVEDKVNHYKIWSPEARRDPHRLYAQMRAEVGAVYRAIGPVSGNTFWFLLRYEDCVAALKNPVFIKEWRKVLNLEQAARMQSGSEHLDTIDRHMLNLDPPDHTRLRGLVHKAFTPRLIDSLRPRLEDIAEELLDALLENGAGQFDLIDGFAFPLPAIVIAELLGIPREDRDQFRAWTRALLHSTDRQENAKAAMQVVMYFNQIFEARRAEPRDDLVSTLLAAEEAGDRLNHQELLGMIFLLLVAGHETTVNLIGNGMLALLQHPDQYERLRDDPSLIKSAVEEMLRYNGPVENTLSRWAYEETEINGHVIQRGDIVLATVAAANRDPEVFDDPDIFDIGREPNKHISFGGGIHFCLGAPLARMEGAIAINALLRRLPNLKLAVSPGELEWNDQIILRGLRHLPVVHETRLHA